MKSSSEMQCAMRRYKVLVYVVIAVALLALFVGGIELAEFADEDMPPGRKKSAVRTVGHTLANFGLSGLLIEMGLVALLHVHVRYDIRWLLRRSLNPMRSTVNRAADRIEQLNDQVAASTRQWQECTSRMMELSQRVDSMSSLQKTSANKVLMALKHAPDSRFRDAGFTQVIAEVDIARFLRSAPAHSVIHIKNTFINDSGDWRKELETAVIERNVTVQMLIMNPNCKVAKARADQLRETLGGFKQHLEDFAAKMVNLSNKLAHEAVRPFEVRFYDEPANYSLLWLDSPKRNESMAWISIFADVPTEPAFVHLEVKWGDWFESAQRDFRRMWDQSGNPVRAQAS